MWPRVYSQYGVAPWGLSVGEQLVVLDDQHLSAVERRPLGQGTAPRRAMRLVHAPARSADQRFDAAG